MSPSAEVEAVDLLGRLPSLLASVPVEACADVELEGLLGAVRASQAALATLVTRIGLRADVLASSGGCAPASELLLGRGAVRGRTARAEARRASLLSRVPELQPSITSGAIGPDPLDSLARHVTRLSDEELASLDVNHLVAEALRLPADSFDALVKRAVDSVAAKPRTTDEKRAASEFRHWFDAESGMGHLHGVLDPERYEALTSAVDQHTTTLAANDDEPRAKNANLAAAALAELVTGSSGVQARRPHITIVINDSDGAAQTGDGHELAPAAVQRLSCDSEVGHVVHDRRGLPINVGRRHRTATAAQWTAIRSMYSTCAWNGCQRPLSHCQLHHILAWCAGGLTDLDNLIPLCSEHHHRVHEGGWSIQLTAERSLIITRPDGAHHATTKPPGRWPPGR